jgi:predicted RNA binding protein YcfA (HicA-like mRNA interferase family)
MSTQKMIRWIRAQGWSVRPTSGGHLVCRHPDTSQAVYAPASPSDSYRVQRQMLAQFRRALKAGKKP